MSGPLAMRFVQSAARVDQLPECRAEVALVGRSNVGKSSLLNALAHRKQLARTSKAPGATRLLNVFELEPAGSGLWVVDLPGYGYAKVSLAERARWQAMIEGYLTGRPTLRSALVLIDGEIGPTPLDVQTVDWLTHIGVPITFVATKADKVRASTSGARRADLATKLGVRKSAVTWVSAAKGTGVPDVRRLVTSLLS